MTLTHFATYDEEIKRTLNVAQTPPPPPKENIMKFHPPRSLFDVALTGSHNSQF